MGELNTISVLYDKLVYAGIVLDDPGQKGAIKALDALYIEVNSSFNLKNIFSENKNILALNKEEKDSLIEFFNSYDKNNIVNIINDSSVLRIAKYKEKKKIIKKEINIANILEELHQDLLGIENFFLPSNYVLSEVDDNISKVGNLLWDAIGLDDSEKILACLKILIEKNIIIIFSNQHIC